MLIRLVFALLVLNGCTKKLQVTDLKLAKCYCQKFEMDLFALIRESDRIYFSCVNFKGNKNLNNQFLLDDEYVEGCSR